MNQEPLRLTSTAELLKAVELGIVDKTEARAMLGLAVKRGRFARLQAREGGRFAKDGQVLPFNRFSAPAKEALVAAQQLAEAASRKNVQSDDMLLALAAGDELHGLGIDEAGVRKALAGVQLAETSVEGIGPTAELKAGIERAFSSVEYPEEVGLTQLLLGLLATRGRAGEALRGLGVTAKAIRA